jgi:hypothetical protein
MIVFLALVFVASGDINYTFYVYVALSLIYLIW